MISPKLTVLMATMAVLGASAPAAFADNSYDPSDPSVTVSVDQDIDRNNEISQSITQSNEACTNTVVAIEDDDGDQTVYSEQSNDCEVYQSNEAEQEAEIDDESYNELFNIALFD